MEQIRSRKNQYILHLRALARDKDVRRDAGEYVCDGEKLLREALQFGAEVTSVLWRDAAAFPLPDGAAQYTADAELVAYASPLMHSPGPVFTVRLPEMRLPQPLRHVIVLEGVQDPGNVGTVIRTANALGMDAVVLTGACARSLQPQDRARCDGRALPPAGADVHDGRAAQLLHARGLKLYGAALTDAAQDLRCVPLSPAAVAIGSEGRGLSAQLLAQCDGDHHPHAAGGGVAQCGGGRGGRHVGDRPHRDVRRRANVAAAILGLAVHALWRAPKMKLALVEHFGTPRDVYFATEADYRVRVPLRPEELRLLLDKDLKDANRALAICDREHIRILTIQDAAYPQRLLQIYDPPLVLYVRGTLPQLDDRAAVAVVGTRSATPYGVRTARKFGFEIVRHGGIVLSGLTAGIDRSAAEGALHARRHLRGRVRYGDQPGFCGCIHAGGRALRRRCERVCAEYVRAALWLPAAQPHHVRSRGGDGRGRSTGEKRRAPVCRRCRHAGQGGLCRARQRGLPRLGRQQCAAQGRRPSGHVRVGCAERFSPHGFPHAAENIAPAPETQAPEPPPETGSGFAQVRRPVAEKRIDKPQPEAYIDLEAQLKSLTTEQLQIVAAIDAPGTQVDLIIEKTQLPGE